MKETTTIGTIRCFFSSLVAVCVLVLCSSSSDHEDVPSNNEIEKLRNAAKRLMQATLTQSSSESSLEEDWTLILGNLLDFNEVETLIQEAKEAARTVLLPNLNDKNGECGAVQEQPQKTAARRRQVQGILNASTDPDCLEREFDASSSRFDVEEAARVFEKCRLLVLRNVFSPQIQHEILPQFRQYIHDITTGRISSQGTTTFGGDRFILNEDVDRFNYMLTQELVEQSAELFAHPLLLRILSNPHILGEDMILNYAGTLNAIAGAQKKQYWHYDGDMTYLVDENDNLGIPIAGHDLPPYAINMFTPLLNITLEHGPTEFCMATSWLRGLEDVDAILLEQPKDKNLQQLLEFEWQHEVHERRVGTQLTCPPPFSRAPLLQKGDVVLFDYMVTHRGGANAHTTDMRSLVFGAYSRQWYRDPAFDVLGEIDCDDDSLECELEHLTKLTRFAVVEEAEMDES